MAALICEDFGSAFKIENGSVDLLESGGTTPVNIVRTNQAASVKFSFKTTGPLNPYVNGNWRVQALFERMGAGPELNRPVAPMDVPVTPSGAPEIPYSADISLSPGTIPAGLYRLTAVVTHAGPISTLPIAAHADLGFVQFYNL